MSDRNKEAILSILLQKNGVDPVSAQQRAAAMVGANPAQVICDEFGHVAVSAAGVHIDSWGAGPFKITVGDETFEFEDSDRFGPMECEDGEPTGFQLEEASPFWDAWKTWKSQGRRVAADGITCLWEHAP